MKTLLTLVLVSVALSQAVATTNLNLAYASVSAGHTTVAPARGWLGKP